MLLDFLCYHRQEKRIYFQAFSLCRVFFSFTLISRLHYALIRYTFAPNQTIEYSI